ncbi:hypothetical protein PHLCEN_2v286 [Hermanssonia centrifuga]|uniref:Metallo-beta-lactamase domain-containing protein n=1 Tax=Hermanssonia centrifuga TaxID=98765 RepID=A0A2R6S6A4_9APHY|nr:hypothetical protein PHLCEN_2v286 [Hermanssonia centrifuga]
MASAYCFRETHAHADHLTSSQYLKSQLGGNVPVCIGARIAQVQNTFASVYGFDNPAFFQNTFDIYFEDDFEFALGGTTCRVMHLPGHTPDHIGYVLGGAIFTGDSIFNPDVGSARADFPGGSVTDLYSSIQRLLSFPEDSLLFVGHDYPAPGNRTPIPCTTVREQKDAWNKKDKTEFIEWRQQRDATLSAPRLLHPSLQVNIRAGKLPLKDESGRAWLKTPLRGVDRCWPNCAY